MRSYKWLLVPFQLLQLPIHNFRACLLLEYCSLIGQFVLFYVTDNSRSSSLQSCLFNKKIIGQTEIHDHYFSKFCISASKHLLTNVCINNILGINIYEISIYFFNYNVSFSFIIMVVMNLLAHTELLHNCKPTFIFLKSKLLSISVFCSMFAIWRALSLHVLTNWK